jgi:GT2 family glycosyltransferase
VPCKDEIATLTRSLLALRQLEPRPLSIVVVDNGSTDGSREIAEQLADRVLDAPGASISGLRNLGAAALPDVDVLAFVDADCEVAPDWLRVGLKALEHHDLVGARTRAADDASWVAQRWATVEAARAHSQSKVWSQHMLIRRVVFDRLGGFDEELPTGEDADLSTRVVASGGSVLLEPTMAAVHHGFPADLQSFLRRERWHTRAPGWFPRMSRSSRVLVLAGAVWCVLGVAAAVASGRRRWRPVAFWGGASAVAVPSLGVLGARSVRHAPQDGLLLALWLLIRIARLPNELLSPMNRTAQRP